jgi:hypothetical protein
VACAADPRGLSPVGTQRHGGSFSVAPWLIPATPENSAQAGTAGSGSGGAGTPGSGGSGIAGGSTPAGTGGAAPAMSSGGGKMPTIPSNSYNNDQHIAITAANMEREYVLSVPTNYENTKPYKADHCVPPARWRRQSDVQQQVLPPATALQ